MSTYQFRRGTAAAWTSANPTLASGEPGFETDTGKMKVGDGSTAWNSLSYFTPGVAGVSDGDKGDITVSASGATWTIDDNAVTFAKMEDIATEKLIGRHSAGSGDPQQVGLDGGLEFSGANIRRSALTGDATASAGSNAVSVVKIQGKDFPTLSAADDQKYPKYDDGTNAFVMTTIAGGGDVTGPGSATDNAIARFDGTGGKTLQNSGVTISDGGTVTLAAGTTSVAPIKFQAGTNLTTAEDGAIEMDADCFYGCTDAGNRGIIPVEHFIRADATRTFTSNTSQQAIFDNPANGALTLETGTYLFEGLIAMTSMSGTSGNGKFSIIGAGTATLGSILWQAYGNDNAAETTGAAVGGSWHVIATQTAANIITAATGAAACFLVKGTFEVTGAGTIIPSFAQTTAAAAVVSVGSYFKCNRVGSTSVTSVGQWT